MRALLISPSAVPGGAERAFAGLVRCLPSQGIDVVPVLLQDGPLAAMLAAIGNPATILPAHRFRRVDRTTATVLALARAARAAGADVIVSNMSKGHVVGGLAARLAGVPAVWWQHGIPERSRIERAAGAVRAAAIACVGDDALAAQRLLTPRARLAKIAPGIPIETVRASAGSGAAVRASLGWQDAVVVGILGRLEPWKGQETFLRAAAALAPTDARLRFAVVGGAVLGWEGSYADELERLAVELGIADRTVFAGHQDDPWAWLDAFDVAVHSSTGEPFGLTVVEAMALGKPVVATAAGGPLETVEDGVTGLLVAPGDHAATAAAVGRLVASPEFAASLGDTAAASAGRFDESLTAAAFGRLLHSVVAAPATVRVHIASYNTAGSTELTIRSARRLAGYPFDLVVGDSGSTDGSAEILAGLERSGLIRLQRSDGRRQHWEWLDGWLAECEADYAVFLDSDVELLRRGWLRELVAAALREGAVLVGAEALPEGADFVEPVGGKRVRLASRPSPWVLLADPARLRPVGASFAFASEETTTVPEGLIAYDVGAALARAAEAAGLRCVTMPTAYRRSYRHYGGLSWLEAPGSRGRKKARDLRAIERRVRRARRLASTEGTPT